METLEPTKTTLSAYELERGKPMPGFNHSIVQVRIGYQLMKRLEETHAISSEVNLQLDG